MLYHDINQTPTIGEKMEIRFYHLLQQNLQDALPQIIAMAYGRDMRSVIKCPDAAMMKSLDQALWSYRADSFLPHATEKDDAPENQPIYLTTTDEKPNQASLLVLVNGVSSEQVAAYDLCCEIFDGLEQDVVQKNREKWMTYKQAGYELIYYQQDHHGKWFEKTRHTPEDKTAEKSAS